MIVEERLCTTYIRKYILVGSLSCLNISITGEERLIAPRLPVKHLATTGFIFIGIIQSIFSLRPICFFTYVTADIGTLCTAASTFKLVAEQIILTGCRPLLVIVVDKIQFMSTTITCSVAPVVYHIIKDVMMTVIRAAAIQTTRDTPVTTFTVGQQIMMERAWLSTILTSPNSSCIAMTSARTVIGMTSNIQSLTDKRMLQGDCLGTTRREGFVNRP